MAPAETKTKQTSVGRTHCQSREAGGGTTRRGQVRQLPKYTSKQNGAGQNCSSFITAPVIVIDSPFVTAAATHLAGLVELHEGALQALNGHLLEGLQCHSR